MLYNISSTCTVNGFRCLSLKLYEEQNVSLQGFTFHGHFLGQGGLGEGLQQTSLPLNGGCLQPPHQQIQTFTCPTQQALSYTG